MSLGDQFVTRPKCNPSPLHWTVLFLERTSKASIRNALQASLWIVFVFVIVGTMVVAVTENK